MGTLQTAQTVNGLTAATGLKSGEGLMKKTVLPILVLLLTLVAAAPVSAGETSAATASLDGMKVEKGLATALVDGNELVKKHCTGCHTEGRIMTALQAMRSEQAENFDKQMKSIILRKIRLTNGSISRQDGKKIIDYLVAIWQRQKQSAVLSMPVFPAPARLRS
jgi:mono/diheme cytochrome c family protein